jgi:Predicted periplasmic lipoprotein (DUF2279)
VHSNKKEHQIAAAKFISVVVFLAYLNSSYSQAPLNSILTDSLKLTLKKDTNTSASELKLKTTQQKPQQKYSIDYVKFGLITGATIGAFWWLHNYQKNAWWSDQRGEFHFANDWDYAMSADKLGHFFDGALVQAIYRGAFEWAGFSPTASVWIGAAFSIAYMTDIEIEDGFATQWGFSPGDQLMNVTGALYPVAQYYWSPLRSFNMKWSYCPSEDLSSGNKNGAFLDDYNGQTFWFSVNVQDLLPKKSKSSWPDYLNIVTGYGVNHYTDFDKRYADYYIGLDLNWERIIPGESKFMLWFKNVINHFRFLPLPVLKINKDGVTYSVNF